jgi:DNA-binding MarR family transcriptional regulator
VDEAYRGVQCLGRLSELYRRRREQLAVGVGLTDQQWEVLEEIATDHFLPSLFARRRESSAAAVSRMLRQLVDKGLAVAAIGREDARQRRYSLTARGRRVMHTLRKSREDAIREVWLALAPDDLRAFTATGERLAERLEGYAAAAEPRRE